MRVRQQRGAATVERDEEARCRNEANRLWLERALREGADAGIVALVVITPSQSLVHEGQRVRRLPRPARARGQGAAQAHVLVHGDTHIYRVDNPIGGITRLETYGSPFVGG
jgi:hypothetical protein